MTSIFSILLRTLKDLYEVSYIYLSCRPWELIRCYHCGQGAVHTRCLGSLAVKKYGYVCRDCNDATGVLQQSTFLAGILKLESACEEILVFLCILIIKRAP